MKRLPGDIYTVDGQVYRTWSAAQDALRAALEVPHSKSKKSAKVLT